MAVMKLVTLLEAFYCFFGPLNVYQPCKRCDDVTTQQVLSLATSTLTNTLWSAEAVQLSLIISQAAVARVHRPVLDLCSAYRFNMSRQDHVFFFFRFVNLSRL
jgi:hypothetical protein